MFGVVGGGVNNDDVVCEVVVLHVGECALKCECFVFYDVVLFLRFVVLSVDVVEFCLNFVCCCIFIVAVMIKSYSAVVVFVVVVIVDFVNGRRRSMS